eukprot:2227825-Pleurochrysis_carterae.AAC.1
MTRLSCVSLSLLTTCSTGPDFILQKGVPQPGRVCAGSTSSCTTARQTSAPTGCRRLCRQEPHASRSHRARERAHAPRWRRCVALRLSGDEQPRSGASQPEVAHFGVTAPLGGVCVGARIRVSVGARVSMIMRMSRRACVNRSGAIECCRPDAHHAF